MMEQIYKYPRTPHIQGSRLQPGDEDLDSIPFSNIASKYLVVEEKVDGANTAISFSPDGQMRLQSRGHYLTGGEREKHFNLFKQWAYSHSATFWDVLGSRYILYGEWLYAKHTVFYDCLPHYFLEYDLLDWEEKLFLSTQCRRELLGGLPLVSVPVLFSGRINSYKQLTQLLTQSHYIQPGHLDRFRQVCEERGLDVERSLSQTDSSSLMEGLYIKVEEDGIVKERYKYVRASFLTTIQQSDGHWLNRPIIPNLLRPDVDLFQS
ncbi:MAG TPA: DNA ligase [Cyanobacteria bacterium UBA11149]|nr:DNA ligase [Cyanobacteria bacterium UBA11367]HBE58559.1 DNA ligase [Cyanobacteria bacterium UBA11366]HBK64770.1 DNA ligase [Cyanobacteria bacterium UBA11166]HBR76505.1 DNA ligase [Cyanobacteria bacterium UBA11159]HBS67875.1 DNA ligase [Cyanobacteria bacterium UBA11153]HBW90086.1 DNA ligase [Cyanobacteria bacterium UBA11149]HCA93726.1 DNA ligase [Cyanobacteria bacterium UBA9226]